MSMDIDALPIDAADFSPQLYARIGGVLCLLIIAAGLFAEVLVRDRVVVEHSAARILSPRLASVLFPAILLHAFIGELSFAAWLTVKGINVAEWRNKVLCRETTFS